MKAGLLVQGGDNPRHGVTGRGLYYSLQLAIKVLPSFAFFESEEDLELEYYWLFR